MKIIRLRGRKNKANQTLISPLRTPRTQSSRDMNPELSATSAVSAAMRSEKTKPILHRTELL
jgi:hypothetical protein